MSSPTTSKSLSDGAIAGIVIGVVAFAVFAAVAVYYIVVVPRSRPSSIYAVSNNADNVVEEESNNNPVSTLTIHREHDQREGEMV